MEAESLKHWGDLCGLRGQKVGHVIPWGPIPPSSLLVIGLGFPSLGLTSVPEGKRGRSWGPSVMSCTLRKGALVLLPL